MDHPEGCLIIVFFNTGDNLGACRELAPSKQESTTYEPSLVCKLLIFGCRPLIPDRLLVVEELDLGEILKSYQEERGYPPYHPVMTTAVILYGYCQGI